MDKLNFRGYLISRFYPIREIRENLMHAKNMFYSKLIKNYQHIVYTVFGLTQ